jgi:hypothetical protein
MPHLRFAGGRPPTAPSGDKADWSRQAGPFLQEHFSFLLKEKILFF